MMYKFLRNLCILQLWSVALQVKDPECWSCACVIPWVIRSLTILSIRRKRKQIESVGWGCVIHHMPTLYCNCFSETDSWAAVEYISPVALRVWGRRHQKDSSYLSSHKNEEHEITVWSVWASQQWMEYQ